MHKWQSIASWGFSSASPNQSLCTLWCATDTEADNVLLLPTWSWEKPELTEGEAMVVSMDALPQVLAHLHSIYAAYLAKS